MNTSRQVTKVGNSARLIRPKELGTIQPDFDAQLATAREVMQRRKGALCELAK